MSHIAAHSFHALHWTCIWTGGWFEILSVSVEDISCLHLPYFLNLPYVEETRFLLPRVAMGTASAMKS